MSIQKAVPIRADSSVGHKVIAELDVVVEPSTGPGIEAVCAGFVQRVDGVSNLAGTDAGDNDRHRLAAKDTSQSSPDLAKFDSVGQVLPVLVQPGLSLDKQNLVGDWG